MNSVILEATTVKMQNCYTKLYRENKTKIMVNVLFVSTPIREITS